MLKISSFFGAFRRFNNACAGLVAGASIVYLCMVLVSTRWSDANHASAVYRLTSGGFTRTALGLHYRGYLGLALAVAELLILSIAAWSSTRPADALRRVGLVVLMLWSAVLMAGGLWVFRDGSTLIFTVPILVVSMGRVLFSWSPRKTRWA